MTNGKKNFKKLGEKTPNKYETNAVVLQKYFKFFLNH